MTRHNHGLRIIGDRCQDVHLELAGGRCGVDAFGETDERDAERLEFLEERHKVPEVAPEAVQPPHDEDVEAPLPGVGHESVKSRTPVLRAGHTLVDEIDTHPPAGGCIAVEFEDLILAVPADVGRPMNHLATNLVDVDLARDAQTVASTLTPLEKEVAAQNGSQYLVRVLPYRTEDQRVQGIVLTLVDVTAMKQTERELRATREQLATELHRMVRLHEVSTVLAESDDMATMLDEVLEAAVEVGGADMGNVQLLQEPAGVLIIAAHRGFAQPFLDFFREVNAHTDSACGQAAATHQRVVIDEVRTSPIFAGSDSLAVLMTAGVHGVQSTPLLARSGQFIGLLSTHYRAPHVFGESELRWLDLLTRHAAEAIARRRTDELLAHSHAELEQRVADRTKWLTLMHDVTRAINDAPSWDEGLYQVLRRICDTGQWQIGFVYLPDRDDPNVIATAVSVFSGERFRPFHAASERRRYTRGQNLPAHVYAEGVAAWVNGPEELATALPFRGELAKQAGLKAVAALPVRFGADVIAVLELFSDQPHPPNDVRPRSCAPCASPRR